MLCKDGAPPLMARAEEKRASVYGKGGGGGDTFLSAQEGADSPGIKCWRETF